MVSVPSSLSEIDLSRRNRLVVYYICGLAGLVLTYTVIYQQIMLQMEGVDRSIFASFEFIVQTMTTTGYGQDSSVWSHPITFLFVSLTQISGIAIGFFTLRVIIIPLFTGAEVDLDGRLSPKHDHVIICEYRRDSAVLLEELNELDVEYVLLSSDRERAKRLSDDGYAAIHGSPQDAEAFRRANIESARAVITDAGKANVNTILTVRSLDPDIEIITLTDDSDLRDVLLNAGADSVLSPHGVLGHRLAEKAISSFDPDAADTVDLGSDFEVTEIPIYGRSKLVGTRIRDSKIRERTGANIIAAWIDGELQLPPDPDAVIQPNTVLLVAGGHDALEELTEVSRPGRVFQEHNEIIIAGMGEVGQAARAAIDGSDIEVTTIDTTNRTGVDIVADAGSKETLRKAGVEDASALIVGLPDDSVGLLTTVLARSLNRDIEILTRVSDANATKKALSAGADYALSVPRVSARMVASELRGEDVLAPASQICLVRIPATEFAGTTLADSNIYEKSGCRVIAIEDDSGLSSTIDPQRELSGAEQLVIVGTDEAVQQFRKQFDVSSVE
jgi:voltage-gated potassium channel